MSFISQSQKLLCVALIGLAVMVMVSPVRAQFPELLVTVDDTTVTAGDTSAWISVYFQNYQDTLAGFAMRLVLDRPDIMEFRTDEIDTIVDTIWWQCINWSGNICVDSIPLNPPDYDTTFVNNGIDTTGSLISDWELVTARSLTESRHDIKVTGLAEGDQAQPYHLGLPPQSLPELLFRMNVRIYETLPDDDSTVTILIINNLSETNFSDPRGDLIGTITSYNICDSCYCETWDYSGDSCLTGCQNEPPELYDTLAIDTFYRWWACLEWGLDSLGQDSCLNWSSYSNFDDVPGGVYDSMSIDQVPWTVWNENTAFLDSDGGHLSIVVVSCLCGDANNDGQANVGDAVYLIAYIFSEGPPPPYIECADANGDGQVNVGDVVYLIAWIFQEGPDPNCF
jgi:hypothetical protein